VTKEPRRIAVAAMLNRLHSEREREREGEGEGEGEGES
jgi:hypothetical protein